jgi:chemotaxis protein CheX
MKGIMKAVGTSSIRVHVEGWLQLLTLSVREVFQTMLRVKVAPVFEPASALTLEWTAMVGLTGELRGVVMFSCDEASAIRIASKMLGVSLKERDDQTADAIGEVCNMIAGNFKHKVSGLSERCALSPPSVITGTDYRVHRQESGARESLRVTLTFEGAPIYISLEVQR